ncbi:pyridoxamine 5'-phosphate oxidase family protein [bacterium]|nr:pyridoxamine 5'-phosphate oxidase family protein [bacterium]
MNERTIREVCLELMASTDLVYVSTIDEHGYPQIRAMGNLRNRRQFPRLSDFFNHHRDDFLVYLTTNRPSPKMRQIAVNPKACLYYCNFSEIHGLLLGGTIEIVDDPEIRHMLWEDSWIQFYYDGVDGEEYKVLRVVPSFGKGWHKSCGAFEITFGA